MTEATMINARSQVELAEERARLLNEMWATHFRDNPLIETVARLIGRNRAAVARTMGETIRAELPAYAGMPKEQQYQMLTHAEAHLRLIQSLLAEGFGEQHVNLEFVREQAILRAEQEHPLSELLTSYRIGHRCTWAAIRDFCTKEAASVEHGLQTSLLLADFTLAYTDWICFAVAEAYTDWRRHADERRARDRLEFFEELLHGTLGEHAFSEKRYAFARHILESNILLLVARLTGSHRHDTASLETLTHLLARLLEQHHIEAVTHRRSHEVVVILQAQPPTMMKTITRLLHDFCRTSVLSVVFGLSRAADSVTQIPRAYDEAVAAAGFGSTAQPLIFIEQVPVLRRLIDRQADVIKPLLPGWTNALSDVDRSTSELYRTLEAFANQSMSAGQAAHALDVHVNTVYHRLARVQTITGLDPREFSGLLQILLAVQLKAAG